ncbi:Transcriptional regulator, contains XRE-family HTH domain [Sinosporangium album]|uniref:Transcriptional regulator, contains XRE-family HTH domain n=1 Tax=Sinosporangium album TaxID=504805 RepID=A0A1G8EQ85_9ACTN|nr:helix-turn-helix domain-containing protein [Sinosporangium album]SDH72063.1 Transcriptional regulator, contains XRE-family HTH domain [Sinosporangium album]
MPSQGTIGDRVRGLRLSRRMSQAQLAGPDLSDSYVSLIESGKRTPTPVVARLLAERLGCTTEFLLHGIEPRQRIDTELGLRHAELELHHGDPAMAVDRFSEIVKAVGEENVMLAAQARLGRARALEAQGRLGAAVEAFERLRREAAAHPERVADLPLTIALSRCYHRAGDTLRARDLGAHARKHVARLGLTQGEIAVELAAALVETEAGSGPASDGMAYVRHVLDVNGVPVSADRSAEVRSLWRSSVAAAQGEDSALAVRLADDAIATGRPSRMAFKLARVALEWSRLAVAVPAGDAPDTAVTDASAPVEDELGDASRFATSATEAFAKLPEARREHADSLVVLAHIQLRLGNPGVAAGLAGSALELLANDGSSTVAASAHLVLAQVALDQKEGDPQASLQSAHRLLESLHGSISPHPDRRAGRAWRELGDLYGQVGAHRRQTGAYRRALEAAGVRSALVGVSVDSAVSR